MASALPVENQGEVYVLSDEEKANLPISLAEVERGELASEKEFRAIIEKFIR